MFPSVHIDGGRTLSENIADVAGLAAAHDAYRASLKGKAPPTIDGMSGDQRFFLAYSQLWAEKLREEMARGQLASDVHAPGTARVATVRNLDAWNEAFGVHRSDRLFLAPEQRGRVW